MLIQLYVLHGIDSLVYSLPVGNTTTGSRYVKLNIKETGFVLNLMARYVTCLMIPENLSISFLIKVFKKT